MFVKFQIYSRSCFMFSFVLGFYFDSLSSSCVCRALPPFVSLLIVCHVIIGDVSISSPSLSLVFHDELSSVS